MILSVMIINNFGRARLCKFYERMPEARQQQVVKDIFGVLSARQENSSSFADASSCFGVPGARIVYRQYATLYFIMVIDSNESELSVLDLIQVLVETLDRHFKNVCELDVIFNSEQVHWVIDEMVVAGLVVETSMQEILAAVEAQSKRMREGDVAYQALEAVQGVLQR